MNTSVNKNKNKKTCKHKRGFVSSPKRIGYNCIDCNKYFKNIPKTF